MPGVNIDSQIIRPHDGVLNLLELGERDSSGARRALEIASRTAPAAEHRDLGGGATGVYADDRLIAFAHPEAGTARVLPQLELLTPAQGLAERAVAEVEELSRDRDFIPEDHTGHRILAPQLLRGSRGTRRRAGEIVDYLGFARIRRELDGLPIVGVGSQATAMVSVDGIEGLTHNWRPAEIVREFSGADIDVQRVAEAIVEALQPVAEDRDVRVDSVKLAYYDGDGTTIQPVYRYSATFGGDGLPTGRLLGIVPAIEAFEELPVLIAHPTELPSHAESHDHAQLRTLSPTIGRYVVRNDNAGWVTSANSFLSGLRNAAPFNGFSPIDRQYYWAEPRLFTDDNHSFVDSVQVALTEVHGNWNLFTTLQNNADFVRLGDIPTDGYGGAAGAGSLAYWILHSCEVIPTSTDSADSYDVWWSIFNGMRAALGYRTEMWINDEITSTFGFLAGLGAPMVSNWLTTVINDDSYSPDDKYFDGNVNMNQPMGRPSAVTVLGHADDTIFQTAPLARPSVLQQWWFEN